MCTALIRSCLELHVHVNQIIPLFFFNDTATTEIYTLSLHDALPIFPRVGDDVPGREDAGDVGGHRLRHLDLALLDRKSTRLNSSHPSISYAVFCLKKKKQ